MSGFLANSQKKKKRNITKRRVFQDSHYILDLMGGPGTRHLPVDTTLDLAPGVTPGTLINQGHVRIDFFVYVWWHIFEIYHVHKCLHHDKDLIHEGVFPAHQTFKVFFFFFLFIRLEVSKNIGRQKWFFIIFDCLPVIVIPDGFSQTAIYTIHAELQEVFFSTTFNKPKHIKAYEAGNITETSAIFLAQLCSSAPLSVFNSKSFIKYKWEQHQSIFSNRYPALYVLQAKDLLTARFRCLRLTAVVIVKAVEWSVCVPLQKCTSAVSDTNFRLRSACGVPRHATALLICDALPV